MHTRFTVTVLVTLLGLTLTSACSKQNNPPPTTPTTMDPRPVSNSSPYWCDVIPQEALRLISGLSIPLQESKDGVPTTHGGCLLRNDYPRFSLNWSTRGGDNALKLAQENFGRRQLADLPPDLGKGLIAYTEDEPTARPYVAFMLFRCDDKHPWMGMDLSEVAKNRSVATDFIALLRIARDRYGEIHNCTPKAA